MAFIDNKKCNNVGSNNLNSREIEIQNKKLFFLNDINCNSSNYQRYK